MKMPSRLLITVICINFLNIYADNELEVPILQPGSPGESSIEISSETAINIANSSYTKDDIMFMQGMIIHHHQATVMSKLAPTNTNNKSVLKLAGRIDVSQKDEISFMKDWLNEREQDAPDPKLGHVNDKHQSMHGMASSDEIYKLTESKGTKFDKLFLKLMIAHHDGALKMVKELKDQPGSAYDPALSEFVADIENDQAVEIERMNALLINLSDDPRAGLSAGLYDAEIAILNMELLESQRKPLGFFDPNNPIGSGSKNLEKKGLRKIFNKEKKVKTFEKEAKNRRYPMLSFSNTDMEFRDDILIAGSYHGFNIYRINDEGIPKLLTSVICPGGQGDVSIIDDLLIFSVEQTRGRVDCGLEGVSLDSSPDRFRGIRIFDISDLSKPKQVGAVQTCRGSHTHSVVSGPDDEGKIIVYSSGIGSVREEEELNKCIKDIAGDDRTALFRIDVIEIPINEPSKSKIVNSPAVFADPETGTLAGLWRGGDHGENSQETNITDQCHDITVFPSSNVAAGACSGNGILFDITNPFEPTRIDVVTDTGFAYWHSATFNNEGTKILFTDEWGGGTRARCRAWDPINWGADAIYDLVDNKLEFKSHYKMPAPQLETENCVAHNGSIVPVPGRDIFVQAWYQGGISVIDFTDSSNPIEIAYFDRGPIKEDELITGGYWSVYYYEGKIYGTEITRGLDSFILKPSEYLTKNEIEAAKLAYPIVGSKRVFNPQQQIPMTWPSKPVVAKAYLDQLNKDNLLDEKMISRILSNLDRIDSATGSEELNRISKNLDSIQLTANYPHVKGITRHRLEKLELVLKEIAKNLRK